MITKNETTMDFDNEIKIKRLNPDFLSKLISRNLETINSEFDVSILSSLKYRKAFKEWDNGISKPIKQIADINKKAARAVKLVAKIQKLLETQKDYSKQNQELQEIMTYIETTDLDFSRWSEEGQNEFRNLVHEREKFLSKNRIGLAALSALFNDGLLKMLFSLAVFIISFVLSFFVGDILENAIEELGPITSKLIPALLFFITLDKLVEKLETWLTWKRIEYLHTKYNETILSINRQSLILMKLKESCEEMTHTVKSSR